MASSSERAKAKRAEKVQRMQAEAARRERARRLLIAGAGIAVVLLIVAGLVVAKLVQGSSAADSSGPSGPASASLVKTVTTVPGSTLDSVGAGQGVAPLVPAPSAPALTSNGHPEVLYVGAEYCPYCAATRWGVVVALSRFGTFHGLGLTTSSHTDVFPDTPTFTFHGSTYTSNTISFKAYETEDRDGKALDSLTGADSTTFATYDNAPYVPSNSAGSIPFMDIGGKYLLSGSAYDPGILKGMTHTEIADALKDPSSTVAKAVDGEANLITAAICSTTGQQPSAVCTSKGVQAAAVGLGSGS